MTVFFRCLIVMAAAFAPAGVSASGPGAVVFQGVAHDAIYDIAFEGRTGVAVGANGRVVTTEDGGRSWSELPTRPTDLALLGVGLANGRIVVVGQQGQVFVRTAGAWQKVDAGTQERLFSVAVGASGAGVAVGAFGTVLRTADGGASWERVAVDWQAVIEDAVEPHLYATHVGADGTMTIAGEFGLVLRSADAGRTWSAIHRGEASIFGLSVADNGHAIAVGQDGTILVTADGGATWRLAESGTKAILLDAWIDGETAVVVGIRAALSSRDGGATWERLPQRIFFDDWHQVVAAPGGGEPVAGGNGGRIVRLSR